MPARGGPFDAVSCLLSCVLRRPPPAVTAALSVATLGGCPITMVMAALATLSAAALSAAALSASCGRLLACRLRPVLWVRWACTFALTRRPLVMLWRAMTATALATASRAAVLSDRLVGGACAVLCGGRAVVGGFW